MFAIAFDLTVKDVSKRHPKSVAAAYADIGATLAEFGFRWVQGSIYVCGTSISTVQPFSVS